MVTNDLPQSDKQLAEKLAVNLYRLVCIRYLNNQLALLDDLVRNMYVPPTTLRDSRPGEQREMTGNNLLADFTMQKLLNRIRVCPRYPADFFSLHSPYRPFLISHLQKEYSWIIDWYLGDFQQNPEHPEHLQFPVKLGYKVRSKSEALAADRLFLEGILFHYEERQVLSGGEAYPDFVIPITVTERYAWEHHGAMDKEGYLNRTRGKILSYLDNHMFPGINMITTYETRQHPLTEEKINHKIQWLKSRYRRAFPDLPPDESFNLYDLAAYVKHIRAAQ